MLLWRLSSARRAADFDGGFGLFNDGRWNTRGRPVTYCSTVPSLAALEKRVHVADPALLPPQVMVAYDVPDGISVRRIEIDETACRLGDAADQYATHRRRLAGCGGRSAAVRAVRHRADCECPRSQYPDQPSRRKRCRHQQSSIYDALHARSAIVQAVEGGLAERPNPPFDLAEGGGLRLRLICPTRHSKRFGCRSKRFYVH